MLLTNTQVSKLRKSFANASLANIKLSRTHLHKIGQSRGFLGRILGSFIKTRLSLMKNVLTTLAKSILIPLGLTEAASATDATIHKKMFGSGTSPSDLAKIMTLIISTEKMNDIIKIVKPLKESSLLI